MHRQHPRPVSSRAIAALCSPSFFGALSAFVLVSCGDSGAPSTSPAPELPPTQGEEPDGPAGRYVGTVTIDGRQHYGDALVTVDGAVRLYVGGPYVDDGTVQKSRPDLSAQVVVYPDSVNNGGVVVWEGCCGDQSARLIKTVSSTGDLTGQVEIPSNEANWSFDLRSWDHHHNMPASLERLAGQYAEELAPFATDPDMVVNIDRNGAMFFQSAASGCTGNGTVTPHGDSSSNVYDVVLVIEGCNDPHSKWNGTHDGLATTSPSDYWSYDTLLRIWFANRHEWVEPRNAFLMSARLL
jgi:hypothetical protein